MSLVYKKNCSDDTFSGAKSYKELLKKRPTNAPVVYTVEPLITDTLINEHLQ
jgi:hypothetical protein